MATRALAVAAELRRLWLLFAVATAIAAAKEGTHCSIVTPLLFQLYGVEGLEEGRHTLEFGVGGPGLGHILFSYRRPVFSIIKVVVVLMTSW